jgi:drug/metabolite transporter (DMT)-like permease
LIRNKSGFFSPHLSAILQAVLVTMLWSSSWILIKIGLRNNMPPLTFAGLRYTLAVLCLTPVVLLSKKQKEVIKNLSRSEWKKLILLGIILYPITQGTVFFGLSFLPANMEGLLLNLAPIFVALFGIFLGQEKTTMRQWLGIFVAVSGISVYFLPFGIYNVKTIGIIIALVGVFSNAFSSLLGRHLNFKSWLTPLVVTYVSMTSGTVILLLSGLIFQGFGNLTLTNILIIAWLAVVNTAFAFTVWNNTLKVVSAVESSILNSLMLPQITFLAYIILGEYVSLKQIAGLFLVMLGVVIVQLRKKESYLTSEK